MAYPIDNGLNRRTNHSSDAGVESYSASTDGTSSSFDTVVIHFQKPRRKFHGNHWFHICEHYLSQQVVIRDRLLQADRQLSITASLTGGAYNASIHTSKRSHSTWIAANDSDYTPITELDVLRSIKHVKIIIRQHELSTMMTRYAFYLVVLAVYQPGIESIELFPPVDSYRQSQSHLTGRFSRRIDAQHTSSSSSSIAGTWWSRPINTIDEAIHSMVSFVSEGPCFGFYSQASASNRIVDYSSIDSIRHHHHHHPSPFNSTLSTMQRWMAWLRGMPIVSSLLISPLNAWIVDGGSHSLFASSDIPRIGGLLFTSPDGKHACSCS